MSQDSTDVGAFLAGFVIGGLIGAATALMLTPQSGEELRSGITNRGQELRQAGSNRIHHYQSSASETAQQYREKAQDLASGTRERVQDAGHQVQEQARIVLDAGKERAGQVKEQASQLVNRNAGENSTGGDSPAPV